MWPIILTAFCTLIVTIMAGLALDFVRNSVPKVTYWARDAIPIKIDKIYVGAYVLSLSNASKRTVNDVTCRAKVSGATLKNGGISSSKNLVVEINIIDNEIEFVMPYLKGGEEFQATIIGESDFYLRNSLDIKIRSPNEFKLRQLGTDRRPFQSKLSFLTAASLATIIGGIASIAASWIYNERTTQDVLTRAASISRIPKLTELYAISPGRLKFYNQGDLAFALADAASDSADITKYRDFLKLIIDTPGLLSASRAHLLYNLGKIELILKNRTAAADDFRRANSENKSTLEGDLKADPSSESSIMTSENH